MPFQPGNKLGKGRKPGAITLASKLKEMGLDPVMAMAEIAKDKDDPNYFKALEFLARRVSPERKPVDENDDSTERVVFEVETKNPEQ